MTICVNYLLICVNIPRVNCDICSVGQGFPIISVYRDGIGGAKAAHFQRLRETDPGRVFGLPLDEPNVEIHFSTTSQTSSHCIELFVDVMVELFLYIP